MISIKSCRKGFTLIEILVVVVILAALAAMILPRFISQVDRAEAAEMFQLVGAIRRAMARTYAQIGTTWVSGQDTMANGDEGSVDGDWSWIGLKDMGPMKPGSYIQVEPEDDQKSYRLMARVHDTSNEINLTENLSTGATTWTCTGIFKTQANGNGCTL